MRKKIVLSLAASFIIAIYFFNTQVTTRQGIDYKWHDVKLPLYLKILDFFDRHYNYLNLVKKIITGANNDDEKAIKIFEWTYHNIKKTPYGFPVIDDHIWSIIVRGYGDSDQISDVFCTLCNYAGLSAYFFIVEAEKEEGKIIFSFVKIRDKWSIFDPYRGVYFVSQQGGFADSGDLTPGRYIASCLEGAEKIDYTPFFKKLPMPHDAQISRSRIQSPVNRFIYALRKSGLKRNDGQSR